MARRRRSMPRPDLLKRAPPAQDPSPSSPAVSPKPESTESATQPSAAAASSTNKHVVAPSTPVASQQPAPSALSFANGASQSVIAFPEPSSANPPLTPSSSSSSSSTSLSPPPSLSASPTQVSSSSSASTSTSSSSTPTGVAESQSSQSALSGGAIGAIVAIVVIIFLGAAAFLFIKRRQKRNDRGIDNNSNDRLARFSMMGPTYNATGNTPQQAFNNQLDAAAATGLYSNSAYSTPAHPAMAQVPPPPPNMQQHQQQQLPPPQTTLSPPPPHPSTPHQPSMGAQPLTVAAGSAPEPMSATIITTPTTPEHPSYYSSSILANESSDQHYDHWQQPPPAGMQSSPQLQLQPQQQQQQQQHAIGTYQVAAGYSPTLADEIEVRPGDHVQVLAEYDDGWCMGTNLTTGQQNGMFPMQCLGPAVSSTVPDPASAEHPQLGIAPVNNRLSSLYAPAAASAADVRPMSHAY